MLAVRLLGPPEASVDGEPLAVDTRKALALLAYLVVDGTASRDTLAGLLWGDSSQERARATLRRTLSALRAASGIPVVTADRNLVALTGEVDSDISTIASEIAATAEHGHDPADVCAACIPHLRRAAALYRGDFLAGFSIKSTAEFEDWVRAVAESTRLQMGEALNRLALALAGTGDYAGAVTVTRRWLELDPLHEPAHRFLMLLHAWSGDRPGAMEAYRDCVSVLERELGVNPLEETTELYGAILDEDLPPAPGGRRQIRVGPTPRPRPQTDLIDRVGELGALRDALTESASGRGRVVTVAGAAWMGKTRLIEELGAEATAREHVVITGRAFRMEQTLPYGVVTQVLRAAMPLLDATTGEIPDWASAEMGRLLPETVAHQQPGGPDRFGELRLLEGVRTVLSTLSTQMPLVIAIDDAQWADSPSATVLSYLARRIETLPILVLVAVRTGEEMPDPVAELVGIADTTVTLGPLVAADLIAIAGDEGSAAALVGQTGGVPLLIAETIAGEDDAQPMAGMARYIQDRLAGTSDLARQVLTAAAVLTGVCDPGLLRETSGRSEEEVVDAIEELLGAGLLREIPESEGLTFTLDALERVVYDSTSLVRRRLLHRRAARALSDSGHADSDAQRAAAVASQHLAAGDPEAAVWYRRAGDLARALYANDSAREFYEAALALGTPDVSAIRLGLGELAMAVGDYERARRELTLAAASATHDQAGLIEHRAGEVERLCGRFGLAEEHFAMSVKTHPVPAALLADWALLAHRTGDDERARSIAEQARAAAETKGEAGQLSRVHNILAVVSSDRDDAVQQAEEAIRLAGDDDMLRMAALNNKALLLSADEVFEASLELLEEAIAIAVRTGHRHREAALWNHLADLHHRAGRAEESRRAQTRAVELFAGVESGDLDPEPWFLTTW